MTHLLAQRAMPVSLQQWGICHQRRIDAGSAVNVGGPQSAGRNWSQKHTQSMDPHLIGGVWDISAVGIQDSRVSSEQLGHL